VSVAFSLSDSFDTNNDGHGVSMAALQAMLVSVIRTQLNTTTFQPTEECKDVCVKPLPHFVSLNYYCSVNCTVLKKPGGTIPFRSPR
jgi:hypothetical protein